MQAFIIGLSFTAVLVGCIFLAAKGFRGVATSRSEGYGELIPDRTVTDPIRRRKANNTVAFWATFAGVLCVPPIIYSAYIAIDPERSIPKPILIALAVYSIAVCSMAMYPLDKIKK